jgi:molecular chaperone GrpE
MTAPRHEDREEGQSERVVIRDNRKIDPVTGEARKRATPPPDPAAEEDIPKADSNSAALLLEERTADLQRLQAEYANYRKRAERDRLAAGDHAVGRALTELLPVLDDLDRAAAHGDLTGALKAFADKLEAALTKLGLSPFGEVGDPFDPSRHEAVMHDESGDVGVPTCTSVLRKGYEHKDRLLRPAMVGVTDPASPPQATEPAEEAPLETRAAAEAEPPLETEVTADGDDAGTKANPAKDEVRTHPQAEQTEEN